jgi:hypothetical protein
MFWNGRKVLRSCSGDGPSRRRFQQSSVIPRYALKQESGSNWKMTRGFFLYRPLFSHQPEVTGKFDQLISHHRYSRLTCRASSHSTAHNFVPEARSSARLSRAMSHRRVVSSSLARFRACSTLRARRPAGSHHADFFSGLHRRAYPVTLLQIKPNCTLLFGGFLAHFLGRRHSRRPKYLLF